MKLYLESKYQWTQFEVIQVKGALNIVKDSLPYDDHIEKVNSKDDADYCILSSSSDTIWDPRSSDKRYYYIFNSEEEIKAYIRKALDLLGDSANWKHKDPNGYEVSSIGDSRFSPFCMHIICDGVRMSIEDYYHYYIKKCTNKPFYNGIWKELKGKVPTVSFTEVHDKSLEIYKKYLQYHPGLLLELILIAKDHPLTDVFDVDGGQNKIYVEILNNLYEQRFN